MDGWGWEGHAATIKSPSAGYVQGQVKKNKNDGSLRTEASVRGSSKKPLSTKKAVDGRSHAVKPLLQALEVMEGMLPEPPGGRPVPPCTLVACRVPFGLCVRWAWPKLFFLSRPTA